MWVVERLSLDDLHQTEIKYDINQIAKHLNGGGDQHIANKSKIYSGAECMETNNLYYKNKGTADIKSRDIFLSLDSEDDITPMEAKELAKKYAENFWKHIR